MMFVYIYSIFIIVWEILCCRFLCESYYEKRKYRSKMPGITVLAMSTGACYLAAYVFYNHIWLKQIAIVIIYSLTIYVLFESSLVKISVLVTLYQGIALLADYGTLLIIGKIFPEITADMLHHAPVSALVTIICKIVLLILMLVIKRRTGSKSGGMLTDYEWLRMLLVPVITMLSLTAIMVKYNVLENINQDNVLIYIALGMAVMNINVFYLINDILEREAIINKERLFREKMTNETNMYYSMTENLEKQRKKTHEFKNHMAYISALANKEQYQELKEYILKIDNDIKVNMDTIDTNNAIVNAVLNAKYREAVNKGIVFILKVNDLSRIQLADMDIVVILSNLLSNAIEACEVSEEKVIKFKFILQDDQMILSVKNSMSKPPVKKNGIFLSQKQEAENHGMGIMNVIEVVEKHGGRHVIDYDDHSFSFMVLMNNK